jgi:transcriptional regulator with XRE-family HTH domain
MQVMPQATSRDLLTAPSPLVRQFGRILRTEMERRGLTQAELAELSGVPRQVISQIVSGKRNTTITRVEHLLDVLGIDDITVTSPRQEAAVTAELAAYERSIG